MASIPVTWSADLRRVAAIPRRQYPTPDDLQRLADEWTPLLLNDRGLAEWHRCQRLPPEQRAEELRKLEIALKPEQALMLLEAHDARGLVAAAPVGTGKTLVTFLLPTVLGIARTVLFIPPSAEKDTHEKFRSFSKYWRSPPAPIDIVTYNRLASRANVYLLCGCSECQGVPVDVEPPALKPDLLILDELDLVRNAESGTSKRIGLYMARHWETVFCGMTGTLMRKRLVNFNRPLIWALKENAPIPFAYQQLEAWGAALDTTTRDARRDPGALLEAFGFNDVRDTKARLARAREGFRRRLQDTAGVVVIDAQSCDQPLTIRVLETPDDTAQNAVFLRHIRQDQTPDGTELGDPLSWLRAEEQAGCGYYKRLNPPPPIEWSEARNAWWKLVRQTVDEASLHRGHTWLALHSKNSEAAVAKRLGDHPVYQNWVAIRDTFVPKTEDVVISMAVVSYAAEWIRLNGPALIWVSHTWVGKTLQRLTGVPFFQGKGRDDAGRRIQTYPGTRSAILSVKSNYRGRNLQDRWCRNLIIAPPFSAEILEQLMGRTHRFGQRWPVHFDVLISCAANLCALQAALAESVGYQENVGITNKLLVAEWDWSHLRDFATMHIDDPAKARFTPRGGW